MKFLVIGLGSMGKRRIRCLKALGYNDIYGFDFQEERLQEAVDKYQITPFRDVDSLESLDVQGWVISTPPKKHLPYALRAIKKNISFFTEADVPDPLIEDVVQGLKGKDIVGMPSCTMSFFDGPLKIKSLLEEGRIGKPLLYTYHSGQYLPDWHPWEPYQNFYVSQKESGACREIVPFELTWINDLLGDVAETKSMFGKVTDLDTDIDDVYQVLLRYKSGMIGHLIVDVAARSAVRLLRLCGSEGTIEWDHSNNKISLFESKTKNWTNFELNEGPKESGYIHSEQPYIREINAFVSAILGKAPLPNTFEKDKKILDLLLTIEKAS
jgi:predicted dehydrogenase